jgi:hypothetical protein
VLELVVEVLEAESEFEYFYEKQLLFYDFYLREILVFLQFFGLLIASISKSRKNKNFSDFTLVFYVTS